MLNIPQENYCRFCRKLFCCAICSQKHENNAHPAEVEALKEEEILQSKCHVCNFLPLPISYKENLTAEMMDHVAKYHLPMQCNKCLKLFETIGDFAMLGKCCNVDERRDDPIEMSKENMGDSVNIPAIKVEEASVKKEAEEDEENKQTTPLAQINTRFQRKNREFGKVNDGEKTEQPGALSKKTSTPLATNIESPLAMHMSSINCMSSSSETDFSPPAMIAPKQPTPTPVIVSPKSKKISTSRTRMPVQNTPLRQLMTKSIQRAFATHGHYKNVGIQQRRMTFDSTSSSNEQTVSLMKLHVESFENQSLVNASSQALDLRMSPALRRDPCTFQVSIKSQTSLVQIEETNIVIRRCESESSLVSNYKSCISEGIATPKVSVSNSNLKKTISFETPSTIDMTPAKMMMPKKLHHNSDSDEDEVFYTPQATPARRYSMESGIQALELGHKLEEIAKAKESSPKKNKFWNWVESAANYAKLSSGSNGSETSEKKFSNIGMVLRRAAGFLHKNSKSSDDENVLKRRRESSSTSSEKFEELLDDKQISSPKMKKRRIQGRKPIERMRNVSLN